jgi:mannose-6-phosphate isomerase-like protein (cupin superfamily)
MRCATALWVLVLCSSFAEKAQVLPTSSGSCGVAPSGLMSCDWLSAAPLRTPDRGSGGHATAEGGPKLLVTRFNLSPSAPLRNMVEGHDVLIIGMGDGELVNETKSPQTHINVRNGSVVLMPKEERYLLRNIGRQDVELLVVDVRR